MYGLSQAPQALFLICPYFTYLKVWVGGFIASDFLYLGFVALCYLAYHSHLYRYAYVKSIICTVLLAINFALIGFGAFLIAKIPELGYGQADQAVVE
jgi:hypothetical protein